MHFTSEGDLRAEYFLLETSLRFSLGLHLSGGGTQTFWKTICLLRSNDLNVDNI